MRVLVVGGGGSIGRAVTRVLGRRHEVLCVSRVGTEQAPHWDSASATAVARTIRDHTPEVVVNAGGSPTAPPADLVTGALVLPLVLLEAMAASTWPGRFVHIGSAAEYGAPSALPLREDAPTRPVSLYGRTKALATEHVLAAPPPCSSVVLRVFNVATASARGGPLGDVRTSLLSGERVVELLDAETCRDYVSADFVGRVVDRACESDARGVVNVCSGRATSLAEIVHAGARLLGREVEVRSRAVAAIPTVFGDPTRLNALGVAEALTPVELAGLVLGPLSSPGAAEPGSDGAA